MDPSYVASILSGTSCNFLLLPAKKGRMKKLLMLLLLAAPASAQTVTPKFTQGQCNRLPPPRLTLNVLSRQKSMVVITIMEWIKRNSQRRHRWQQYNLFRTHGWRSLVSGDHNKRRRRCGDNRHHRNHRFNFYHYLALYLLAVTPAYAEDPKVQNTSNPVAAATGNVTNQAVQFQNNGAPSRQYFGANSSCNNATMTFSPFYMGNDTIPYEADGYVRSNNYGISSIYDPTRREHD